AALSVVTSILTIIFENYGFVIVLFLWLFYLFYNERLRKVPLLAALAFFLFFSLYIPTIEKSVNSTHIDHTQQQLFQGKIVRPLVEHPTKLDFVIKDETLNQKLLVNYFMNNDEVLHQNKYSELAYGANCKIIGQIDQPSVSRNPGQFDFSDYLKSQGISNQIIINNLTDMECEGSSF